MTKILMEAPRLCLEAHAVNELLGLGFDLDHAPMLVDEYLYLVLGGLDYIASFGERNLRDRLQRGLEKDSINKLRVSLAKQKNDAARVTLAQLARKPELFVPRLITHYPIMETQPKLIDWDVPSMGYVALVTFAGGLKAVDSDIEQRKVSTLSALRSRAKNYNTQFKFNNRY